jgi:hypothetical protein
MIPQLRSYLLEHWADLPLSGTRPRNLAFLVQATGISKLCCYLFADNASHPQWVAKIPRAPRDNPVLSHEYSVIQDLRSRGSDFVRTTIPGPLCQATVAEHLVGIERYLPGRPLDGIMMIGAQRHAEPQVCEYLDLAIGWLLRSQRETLFQRGRLTDDQVQCYLLAPIAQLRATSRLTPHESIYLDRLIERIGALAEQPLPLVFQHGDFQPGNILVEDTAIRVIDWEFGAIAALPLHDVFGFLARTDARWHGMEEMDGYLEDYLEHFESVFFESGSFANLTSEYVDRACRELDIDPAWIQVLFALFIIAEANKYHTLLSRRAERGYVYLLRSKAGKIHDSYAAQLARQKHVWLLGHLAEHEGRSIFSRRGASQPAFERRPHMRAEMAAGLWSNT